MPPPTVAGEQRGRAVSAGGEPEEGAHGEVGDGCGVSRQAGGGEVEPGSSSLQLDASSGFLACMGAVEHI